MTEKGGPEAPFREAGEEAPADDARTRSLLAAAVSDAPDALLCVLSDGVIAAANEAACRWLARPAPRLVGLPVWEVAPLFSPARWPTVRVGLEREGPAAFDTHWRRVDGKAVPVEVTAACTRFEGEDLVLLWARDSSRRRQRESELLRVQDELAAQAREAAAELARVNVELRSEVAERQEEERVRRAWQERHRMIADNVTDVVWACDWRGRLTYVSASVEGVLGYTPAELSGVQLRRLLPRAAFVDAVRAFRSGAAASAVVPRVLSFSARHRRGALVACETTVRFLLDERGEPAGIIGTTRDVTERRQMQEALIRSERMAAVGTLAAGVAHEFNNLNAVVLGYADMLLGDQPPSEVTRRRLEAIRQAAIRGAAVAEKLLGFAKTDGVALSPGRLSQAVEEALVLVEEDLRREGIDLVRRIGVTPEALVNEGQLTQVAIHLISNARHALLDRPVRRLEVVTGVDDGHAFLRVSDSGCGIPEAHMSRLFTPFFSTKGEHASGNTPQAGVRGTGLGLSVSHGIVGNHQGTISVESREGVGSTFTVRLPLGLAPGPARDVAGPA